MDYLKTKRVNFSKIRQRESQHTKEILTLYKLSLGLLVIALVMTVAIIVRSILAVTIINTFSWGIDIPLIMLYLFVAVSVFILDKKDNDIGITRLNREHKKNDKELLTFLNQYVVYGNYQVKPVYKFIRYDKSSANHLVLYLPIDKEIIKNVVIDKPEFNFETQNNAYVRYGRTHYAPIKKRKVIKNMNRYLDVKDETERIDYESVEDDFYAKIKQANDLNDVLPMYDDELEKRIAEKLEQEEYTQQELTEKREEMMNNYLKNKG